MGSGKRRTSFVIAALAVLIAAVFGLNAAQAVIAPSTFEGDDGNLTAGAGNKDWDNIAGAIVQNDAPSGQNDPSLKGDEGSTSPAVTAGSIQGKADLLNFRVARESVGGEDFLYLAWERTPDTGTVNFDFELNQVTQGTVPAPSTNGTPWPLTRTEGDILFTFDLAQGGITPTLSMLKWETDAGQACGAPSWTLPCWGVPMVLNPTTTPAAEAGVGTFQDANKTFIWFGEASINLQDSGIFQTGVCTNFGSAYAKSRSSDSPSAALSDFIAPVEVAVNNCGDLTVVKNSGSYDGTFTFDVDCSGGTTFDRTNASITTVGGTGSFVIDDIPNGTTCTVTEDSPAPQWTHTSTSPANGQVTIAGNKTVTFTNARNLGKIVINKTAIGGNGVFSFSVACPGVAGYPLTLGVTTSGGSGSNETPVDIPIGSSCTVTESAASGWSPSGQSANVTVSAASNAVGFTNTRDLGQITVVKNTTGGDGTFQFNVACSGVTGYPKTLTVTTVNGTGSANTGTADIPTGTSCTITEASQTGTWTVNGSASQTVTVAASTTVTFNNVRDMGAIAVTKVANGGDGTFTFTVACSGVTGYPRTLTIDTATGPNPASTPQDIPTGTSCTVTEAAQPGVWTVQGTAQRTVLVDQALESVTFTNDRDMGKIVVNKTAIDGNGTFQFVVACPGVTGYPQTLTVTTVNGSGSAETATNIPTTTSCTVTETAQPGTWTIQGPAAKNVTVTGSSSSVSFTNVRDMGKITVTKQATGGNGTFTFTVACPGVTGYPVTLSVTTVNGAGSASTASNIPTGTDCTVTEAAQPGVWTVAGSAVRDVTVDSAEESVVFSNSRNVGSLTVVVKTEGGNGTFPYTVDCDGSLFDASGSITTAAGTGSAPTIGSIPTGTTCTATQTAQPGWTLTSASPQSVVIDGDEVLTFVNVRNVNSITVDKSASVESATEGDAVTFTYVVRSPGPDSLSSVTVADDRCSPVTYRTGDIDGDSLLDVGELWSYTCQAAANSSAPTNIATATGVDPAGAKVEATDRVTITVVAPQVIARPVEVKGVQLPRTGSDIADLALLGGSLMLLGFSIIFVSRKRRTA